MTDASTGQETRALDVEVAPGRRTKPLVLHYRSPFPVPSETFIRTAVLGRSRYDAVVMTHEVRGAVALPDDIRLRHERYFFDRLTAVARTRFAALRIVQRRAGVRRALASLAPDVLHAHFAEEGVAALPAAERAGVPLVVTFYGYDATELPRDRRWRRRIGNLLQRATFTLAEGPHLRDVLIALGAPPERALVHPIPVRLEMFPFRPPRPRERATVLQACRFVPKKGVDLSLRAFARAAPDGRARLRLVGDGPERPRLESLARELGISASVEFVGMRTHEEYARDLAEADVFIQPSRYGPNGDGEGGAPTALLEAQAVGLVVVASTHADIPFVTDPEAALLAPENDVDGLAARLGYALDHPEQWAERARAGRRLVERQHDAALLAARLEGVYDQARALVPRAGRGRA